MTALATTLTSRNIFPPVIMAVGLIIGITSENWIVCFTYFPAHSLFAQHFLYFSPLPQGQGCLGQIFFRRSLAWAGSATASSRKYPLVCPVPTRSDISIPFL